MSFGGGFVTAPTGNIYASGPHSLAQGPRIVSKPVCMTRILLLSGFASELKTRDLIAVFSEWEDQNGGFRIKWIDDQSAYIVFQDAITAKHAFLATLANPPPSLAASVHQPAASILPYAGEDAESILSSVANRPRSRSNAGMGHNPMSSSGGSLHGRRPSASNMMGVQGPGAQAGGPGRREPTFANRVGAVNGGHSRSNSLNASTLPSESAVV